MLISSIEGAAVTSIKMDGVLHEFGTLPNVLEDVTQIILNVSISINAETTPNEIESIASRIKELRDKLH